MYRVMLIDDEASARNLLRSSIDWESLGMEISGEAASGIEAINEIDEAQPDIAFVDISMPFMNGIEFAEVAAVRYPNLVLIIMTAFDEFEYARKCVSLPVFEYMLKPFVRTEVTEVLGRVKQMLDERCDAFENDNAGNLSDCGDSSVEQIKRYIKDNFTDPQLNLTGIADLFGFSPSYLSRKFKQETGKNFLEYLTECRMEQAKNMASTGMKMFQVANAVGIPDPNYFGRCFKKHTGMSYSEYSKMEFHN